MFYISTSQSAESAVELAAKRKFVDNIDLFKNHQFAADRHGESFGSFCSNGMTFFKKFIAWSSDDNGN